MGVVLITGAARGLGRATAIKFHENGNSVIAVDIDPSVHALQGDRMHTFTVDVTSEDQMKQLATQVKNAELTVSVIVNNAGYFEFRPITDSSMAHLQRIFTLNSLAPFLVIRTFLSDLAETKGRVIQISSENVKLNGLFQPYPSSKIALEALSEGARQELMLLGITLCVVRPGAIQTDLLNWKKPSTSFYQKYVNRLVEKAHERMGSIVSPEIVAELIVKVSRIKNPKRIYAINNNRWLAFFSRMPARVRDKIVVSMISKPS